MRVILILILAFWSFESFSQSSSTHYRSSVRGSLTSGAQQSGTSTDNSVVNVWTEAHLQKSASYHHRTTSVVNVSDSSTIGVPSFSYAENSILVYPNPAENSFYIQSDKVLNSLVAYDAKGKEILRLNSGIDQKIDISSWKGGVYWLRIRSGNVSHSVRLIKWD